MRVWTCVLAFLLTGCGESDGDSCSEPGQPCTSSADCCPGRLCVGGVGICAATCEFGNECESGCCASGLAADRVCGPVSNCTTSKLFACEAVAAGFCAYAETCFSEDFINCMGGFVYGCCGMVSRLECATPISTPASVLSACLEANENRACGTFDNPPECVGIVD